MVDSIEIAQTSLGTLFINDERNLKHFNPKRGDEIILASAEDSLTFYRKGDPEWQQAMQEAGLSGFGFQKFKYRHLIVYNKAVEMAVFLLLSEDNHLADIESQLQWLFRRLHINASDFENALKQNAQSFNDFLFETASFYVSLCLEFNIAVDPNVVVDYQNLSGIYVRQLGLPNDTLKYQQLLESAGNYTQSPASASDWPLGLAL